MASYPSGVYTPASKSAGNTITAAFFNDPDGEITALENALLLTGLAHDLKFVDATYDVGKSGATRPRDLFLSRNAVVGGTLAVTGIATFTAAPVFSAGVGTTTLTASGLATLQAALLLTNIVTDSSDSDQNNWAPTGHATASAIYANGASVPRTITGLAGGVEGRVLFFVNRSASSYLFTSEDGLSTDINRFRTGNSATITCRTNGSVMLFYANTRWHLLSV